MKLKLALAVVLLVSGCRASEPQTPEETGSMPYGKWEFAFFTPRALNAVVTYAAIIDSGNVVYRFRMLDGTPGDPDTVETWNKFVRMHAELNKARHPPVAIMICWDSIIDKKTYETQIIFKPSLREIMLTPTGKDRKGETAWYKTMLFGLAPEGKVKIWLQNSSGGENVPVEPKRMVTLSGDRLDICKGVPTRIDFNYSIPDGYDQFIKDFIKGKTYPYGNW
ncbi:DUF2931 family protein [Leclercia adecarboxylata]|uniref:DUF2931 family protein n=1 Tax=Leclercia adecarboxylata TaxID=83655 RepID=UPI00244CFEC7|nr:DUF2931 family protein [Leclercia adecarboxylata]MDH0064195.1 DUF2931 family protein [Leclercia adecarboxylata]